MRLSEENIILADIHLEWNGPGFMNEENHLNKDPEKCLC